MCINRQCYTQLALVAQGVDGRIEQPAYQLHYSGVCRFGWAAEHPIPLFCSSRWTASFTMRPAMDLTLNMQCPTKTSGRDSWYATSMLVRGCCSSSSNPAAKAQARTREQTVGTSGGGVQFGEQIFFNRLSLLHEARTARTVLKRIYTQLVHVHLVTCWYMYSQVGYVPN